MRIGSEMFLTFGDKKQFLYNDETLKVLGSISSWTIPGIAPDMTAEEKLAEIRKELAEILV